MIQKGTMLKVADNSGAKLVKCIHIYGGSKRRYAKLGDVINVVVKEAEPRKAVKKHEIIRAVVVRQKKPYRRKDGSYIYFDDNACVLLDGNTTNPKGTRIIGPIAREVREKGFSEVAGLAEDIL
ncbi:50S ribosomal protein L14 [bacterium HR34]|nr:50S ribosomal protein L14 [bacterium HR34]